MSIWWIYEIGHMIVFVEFEQLKLERPYVSQFEAKLVS